MTKKCIPIRLNGETRMMTVLEEKIWVRFFSAPGRPEDDGFYFQPTRQFLVRGKFVQAAGLKAGDPIRFRRGEIEIIKSVKSIIS